MSCTRKKLKGKENAGNAANKTGNNCKQTFKHFHNTHLLHIRRTMKLNVPLHIALDDQLEANVAPACLVILAATVIGFWLLNDLHLRQKTQALTC